MDLSAKWKISSLKRNTKMKNNLSNIYIGGAGLLGLIAVLSFLFFGVFMAEVDNMGELLGLGAWSLFMGSLFLAVLVLSISVAGGAKDKNRELALLIRKISFTTIGFIISFSFLFLAASPHLIKFQTKLVKVGNINTKNLCKTESDLFRGVNGEKLKIGESNNCEWVDISFTFEGGEIELEFLKNGNSAKNLCAWIEDGEEIFLKDITVKTPLGVSNHKGGLYVREGAKAGALVYKEIDL